MLKIFRNAALVALLVFAGCRAHAAVAWQDCTTTSYPPNPSSVQAIYISAETLAGFSTWPPFTPVDPAALLGWQNWNSSPGAWRTVDLTGSVPADTKMATIGGILIITNPAPAQDPDILLGFRAAGDTWNYAYICQAISAYSNAGVRQNCTVTVPIVNSKFEMKWAAIDSGSSNPRQITPQTYPVNPSYAINFYVYSVCR